MNRSERIDRAYQYAKEQYAALGVDTEQALQRVGAIPISIHCWQGDDVVGFEHREQELSGGIQATGDYPGRARNAPELRQDLEQAFRFIPGQKKLNLHASYLDAATAVERDEIEEKHFASWVAWAQKHAIGLDFNPTCFSHPLAADGMTLSHPKKSIREFWIRHVRQCRRINASFGRALNQTAIMNIWIPDGYKDTPVDRTAPRERLMESLDACLSEQLERAHHIDAVESKLFGIGLESYVVGSHEFYLAYAATHNIALCLDTGHFHPTEYVSDKLSAVSLFVDDILLHVSRPVRWDSDHVVTLDDELIRIAQEIMRNQLKTRIHVGLDFFDASINRVAAWIIGARNTRRALLIAALEPTVTLIEHERAFDFTARLAYQEELKGYPWSAVWDHYCQREQMACGFDWLDEIREYERKYLTKR